VSMKNLPAPERPGSVGKKAQAEAKAEGGYEQTTIVPTFGAEGVLFFE